MSSLVPPELQEDEGVPEVLPPGPAGGEDEEDGRVSHPSHSM